MSIPSQPLRLWGWIVLPTLLAVLATVVLATPLRVFGVGLPEPVWPMALAFAWPVIRPSIAAPVALGLAGLFLDLFWGAAVGQWMLALLAAYAATMLARPLLVGQGAVVLAGWYASAALVLFGAMHVLTMFDLSASVSLAPATLQWLATAALFPVAFWMIESYEDAGARVR